MLQTGQQDSGQAFDILFEFDDCRYSRGEVVAEKFQADGAHTLRHAMQDEGGGGDHAVTALFLYAGKPAEELVGDILAESVLAECAARDFQCLGAYQGFVAGSSPAEVESDRRLFMNLAEIVIDAHHFEQISLRRHHSPGGEVVQRRSPQHGLLAAGIHGDIAADGASILRGGIHGKGEPMLCRQLGDASRDDAGSAAYGRYLSIDARQDGLLNCREALQLLCIDDGGAGIQRHGRAGVAGAAAARDDGQTAADAG